MTVRVLVADDQPLVRAGLRRCLEADATLELVGEAEDGLGAVDAAARLAPDVVVMDIRMPNVDGIEATRRIVATGTDAPRILILTTFGIDEHVLDALRAGASGFLLKDAPPEEILGAIAAVARGESPLDPAVTQAVVARLAVPDPAARERLAELTPREQEILALLGRGRTNAEIAEALVIAEGTVKAHVAAVLAKIGARDRVQAAIFAYEAGFVRPGDPRR